MTNSQLLDAVGAITQIALDAGIELTQIYRKISEVSTLSNVVNYSVPANKAIDYIHNNYEKPIRIADVAKAAFVSKVHISRIFSSEIGVTVAKYVAMVRTDVAKNKLLNTNQDIADIALSCGFPRQETFSRSFRNVVGITPREYRKRYRK